MTFKQLHQQIAVMQDKVSFMMNENQRLHIQLRRKSWRTFAWALLWGAIIGGAGCAVVGRMVLAQ